MADTQQFPLQGGGTVTVGGGRIKATSSMPIDPTTTTSTTTTVPLDNLSDDDLDRRLNQLNAELGLSPMGADGGTGTPGPIDENQLIGDRSWLQNLPSNLGAVGGAMAGERIGANLVGPTVAAVGQGIAQKGLAVGGQGVAARMTRAAALKFLQNAPHRGVQFLARAGTAAGLASLGAGVGALAEDMIWPAKVNDVDEDAAIRISMDRIKERMAQEFATEGGMQTLFGATGLVAGELPFWVKRAFVGTASRTKTKAAAAIERFARATNQVGVNPNVRTLAEMPMTHAEQAISPASEWVQNAVTHALGSGGFREMLARRGEGVMTAWKSLIRGLGRTTDPEKVGDMGMAMFHGLRDSTGAVTDKGVLQVQRELTTALWNAISSKGGKVLINVGDVKDAIRSMLAVAHKAGGVAGDELGDDVLRKILQLNPGVNPGLRMKLTQQIAAAMRADPKLSKLSLDRFSTILQQKVDHEMLNYTDVEGLIEAIKRLNIVKFQPQLQFTMGTGKGPMRHNVKSAMDALLDALEKGLKKDAPDLLPVHQAAREITRTGKATFENDIVAPLLKLGIDGFKKTPDMLVPEIMKYSPQQLVAFQKAVFHSPVDEVRAVLGAKGVSTKGIVTKDVRQVMKGLQDEARTFWDSLGASALNHVWESTLVKNEAGGTIIHQFDASRFLKALENMKGGREYWRTLLGTETADGIFEVAEALAIQSRKLAQGRGTMAIQMQTAAAQMRAIQLVVTAASIAAGGTAGYYGSAAGLAGAAAIPVAIIGLPAGAGALLKNPATRARLLQLTRTLNRPRVFDPLRHVMRRDVARAIFQLADSFDAEASSSIPLTELSGPKATVEIHPDVATPPELEGFANGPLLPWQ